MRDTGACRGLWAPQRMMALYVASHYKNSPNDLQLMSDAPAHRLFVLLAPVDETTNALPEILCVLQVALEGAVSKQSAQVNLSQGKAPQVCVCMCVCVLYCTQACVGGKEAKGRIWTE
jgi:tRNA(Met) C34 N-acetyltransferase TmcA